MTTSTACSVPHQEATQSSRAPLPSLSSQELRLLHIARLNSEAITHFQHGDRVTAKDTFVFSLGQLKSICEEGDTSQDDTAKCYHDLHVIDILHAADINSYLTATVSVATAVNSEHSPPQDMALYDKAFLLTSDIPCDTAATAAVLLFNAGLLHHKEAIATGFSLLYKKALRFYQQAATLIVQEEMSQHSSTMAVVMAAVLHNLAHCHSTAFLDYASAARCQEQLSALLEWMQDFVVLSVSDMEFFHISLLFTNIQMHECRVAPAA